MPWILLLLGFGTVLRADSANYAGTLPEDYLPGLKTLLQTALQQAPQVLLRQIQLEQNEARVYQADQLRWPSVGGDMRYDNNETGVSGNAGTRSRDSGLFYSLSANQAVFYWGEIKHRGDIARVEVAIAKKDYTEAYRTLAVDLRRSYLDLIARNAELRQMRYSLGLLETDLANARAGLQHGTVPPGDVGAKELHFNEVQLDFDRKQAEFDANRRRLCRLAGIPDIPPVEIPFEVPEPQYNAPLASDLLASLMRDGGKSSYLAEVAEMHVNEADLNYRIARVRLLPKFNASIGHSRESSTTATSTFVSQTAITRDTVELRGNWTIFDGFATKGAKLEALAEKRYWSRQREIASDAAMDEAQRLSRTVELDARAMKYAELRRQGAASLLERAQAEQKAGTASEGNVSDATANMRMAEWNAAITRANFLSDWAAFVSLVADDPVLNNLPRYVRNR